MLSEYDRELIKSEVIQGIKQVDKTFMLDKFDLEFDRVSRNLTVTFTAHNEKGDTVEVNKLWR